MFLVPKKMSVSQAPNAEINSKYRALLVAAFVSMKEGNLEEFVASWKKYRSFGLETPKKFSDLIEETSRTTGKYQFFVDFVKLSENRLMADYYKEFFLAAVRVNDFDAAFSCLMNGLSKPQLTSLDMTFVEILVNAMARAGCSSQFVNFPLGINRAKVLAVMSVGSNVSLFLAATLFHRMGEYSKSAKALFNFVNSVLSQISPKDDDIGKAFSAIIIIKSLMRNHNVYLRDTATRRLIHYSDLDKFKSLLNTHKKKTLPTQQQTPQHQPPPRVSFAGNKYKSNH